jgi:hypothetical protein
MAVVRDSQLDASAHMEKAYCKVAQRSKSLVPPLFRGDSSNVEVALR